MLVFEGEIIAQQVFVYERNVPRNGPLRSRKMVSRVQRLRFEDVLILLVEIHACRQFQVQIADNLVVQHQIEPPGIALIFFRCLIHLLEHLPGYFPFSGQQGGCICRIGSNPFHFAGIATGVAPPAPVAIGE